MKTRTHSKTVSYHVAAHGKFVLWRLEIGRSDEILDFSIRGKESIPLNCLCPNRCHSLLPVLSFRCPCDTAIKGSW